MKCSIMSKIMSPADVASLVVFVDNSQTVLSERLNENILNYIQNLIKKTDFKGNKNDVLFDRQFEADNFKAILLVGLGDRTELSGNDVQKAAKAIYNHTATLFPSITVLVESTFTQQQFSVFSLALLNQSYKFTQYKSKKPVQKLTDICFVSHHENLADELTYVQAVHAGQNIARDLGNTPANDCYPGSIADMAQALAKENTDCLSVEVLGEAEMEKLGMGCFLSVSKGSDREGKLITFDYQGDGAKNTDAPIVFVGKGVTFDTGGISIKPGAGMEEMKFDMCGAASVFGVIKALCEARLPVRVIGTLACAENMPSGGATRPGDIVTSMSGQTVEILNTDAEGRLVLSDALTYVEKYNPSVVINMATLTGACIIALGHVRSALYSKDTDLAADLIAASSYSHDRIWHMPLDDDYQQQLESPIADIQNIGGRPAGSITAACFLSRFTKKYPWAHLDIAGTAWTPGKTRNASGRPVPLLMQYVRSSL